MRFQGGWGMSLVGGVVLAMLIATTVSAQGRFGGPGGPGGAGRGGPPDPAEMLKRLDKNEDGSLSKDEVPEPMWARLSAADADEDGVVTREELGRMARDRFAGGRRGGGPRGGPPARAEQKEDEQPEQRRAERPRGEGRQGVEAGRGPSRAGRPASRPAKSEIVENMFARLDTNDDGSISKEEFTKFADGRAAFARQTRGRSAMRGPFGQGPGREFAGRGPQAWRPQGPWSAHSGRGWAGYARGPMAGRWGGSYRGGPPWAGQSSPRAFGSHPGSAAGRNFGRPVGPGMGQGRSRGPEKAFGQGRGPGRPGGPAKRGSLEGPRRGPRPGQGGPPSGFHGPGGQFRFGATASDVEGVISASDLEASEVEVEKNEVGDTETTPASDATIVAAEGE